MKKLFIIPLFLIALTGVAHAVDNTHVSTTIDNPFGGAGSTLPQLFAAIIDKIILPIGGVVAVISFIWSGFLFVTAQGDEGKLKTAKTALLYTAIGTAILLGASAITKILSTTIDQLKT